MPTIEEMKIENSKLKLKIDRMKADFDKSMITNFQQRALLYGMLADVYRFSDKPEDVTKFKKFLKHEMNFKAKVRRLRQRAYKIKKALN